MPKYSDKIVKIEEHIKIAEDYQNVDRWLDDSKRLTAYLGGKYYKRGYDTKYVINTAYNLVNIITPNLYYRNPRIICSPKRKFIQRKKGDSYEVIDAWRAASLMESLLSKIMDEIGFREEVHKIILDIMYRGFGIMKLGYSPKTEMETNNEKSDYTDIFSCRVCPYDFLFDPMASSMDDCRFVIHRVIKSLEQVKSDENLKNTKDLVGSSVPTSLPDSSTKKKKKEDSKDGGDWVVLYEYHDLIENTITTYCKEGQKKRILWERDNPHDTKGSHFVLFKFTGDNDSFRGIPLLKMVEDQMLALNEIQSLMVNHMELFPGLLMHEEGAIDKDEIEAIARSEQGSILQVQNGALREGRIQRASPLQMGGEYFAAINILHSIIDRTLGIPDYQRAGAGGKRKTATEVYAESSDASVRRDYFQSFIKKGVLACVEKISDLIMQYYDNDAIMVLEGEFSEDISFTKQDIQHDWNFDFDVEGIRAYSPARAQALVQYIQVLGQNPSLQPILAKYDPDKIATEIAKNLDITPEKLMKRSPVTHFEYDPYQENEFAKQHRRLHDPHPGEPHEQHLPIHTAFLAELAGTDDNIAIQELSRHIQMTQFIMQSSTMLPGKQATQQTAFPGQPGAQQLAEMKGPAEAAGGFTYNQPIEVQ